MVGGRRPIEAERAGGEAAGGPRPSGSQATPRPEEQAALTDAELLALLAEKTPDELTEQQIELLRRRLTESAEPREALLGQVQMETYLATALARVNIQPQDI